MEKRKEIIKPIIKGEFPAQRFFDTLALILSRREGVAISVTVTQEEKPPEKVAV